MSIEWQQTDDMRPSAASRQTREQRIGAIGGRQKQLITLRQLVIVGLGKRGVRHRVAEGRLSRLHEGVFALHPPPYSWHQRLLAATYACGYGSFASDLPAAHLLGATESVPSLPHITNERGSGRTLGGIVVHRRPLDRRDTTVRFGIPCTTSARTILDCASSVTIEQLEELLMAADSGRPGLDRKRLEQLVAANAGRRGVSNLRELITDDPQGDPIQERAADAPNLPAPRRARA